MRNHEQQALKYLNRVHIQAQGSSWGNTEDEVYKAVSARSRFDKSRGEANRQLHAVLASTDTGIRFTGVALARIHADDEWEPVDTVRSNGANRRYATRSSLSRAEFRGILLPSTVLSTSDTDERSMSAAARYQ